jgi:hypothetical protein
LLQSSFLNGLRNSREHQTLRKELSNSWLIN